MGVALKTRLSQSEGKLLLALARQTLENKLLGTRHYLENYERPSFTPAQGCFVSLHRLGQLRGCVGQIEGELPLYKAVQEYSLKAALRDPRFPPLLADELREVRLEISVLTPLMELLGADNREKITQIRPFVEGLVIERGHHRATFLPQVWDHLQERDLFLSELCKKAGLAAQAWETEPLAFYTYQAQLFNEED